MVGRKTDKQMDRTDGHMEREDDMPTTDINYWKHVSP